MSENTWLITGASSGLGYALAQHVLEQGDRVVMGARTVSPMSELASRYPERGLAVGLDETRSHFAGSVIDDYEATSGSFRKIMADIKPGQFPGDPAQAAIAIYREVTAGNKRHHLILGSDAYRRIGAKLDAIRSEFDSIKDLAFSTDYPDAGEAIL